MHKGRQGGFHFIVEKCVGLSSPPRIAVLTAGYRGLFQNCKNKVNVVVVVVAEK